MQFLLSLVCLTLEDKELNGENGYSVLTVYYTYVRTCKDFMYHVPLGTDVTAIIFVVACSSFNMVIREDGKTVSPQLPLEYVYILFFY